jgi:hypothetical protein
MLENFMCDGEELVQVLDDLDWIFCPPAPLDAAMTEPANNRLPAQHNDTPSVEAIFG